jgi:hypothetical protein
MHSCVRAIYRIDAAEDGPARARAIIDRELAEIVPLPTLEELQLMVSELVTSGIKFGKQDGNSSLTLDLRIDQHVRCSVVSPGAPFAGRAAAGSAYAWGLKLVAWLADRWGVTRVQEGTRVWFETCPP